MRSVLLILFTFIVCSVNAGLVSHVVAYNMGKKSAEENKQVVYVYKEDLEKYASEVYFLSEENARLKKEVERYKKIIFDNNLDATVVQAVTEERLNAGRNAGDEVDRFETTVGIVGSAFIVIIIGFLVVNWIVSARRKRNYEMRYGRGYYD